MFDYLLSITISISIILYHLQASRWFINTARCYQFLLIITRNNPIYHVKNLSKKYGDQIYLKRKDFIHTGANKINNAVSMALLSWKMAKTKLIAEIGTDQHDVTGRDSSRSFTAQMRYIHWEDRCKKQRMNVEKIKILGANIISVDSI